MRILTRTITRITLSLVTGLAACCAPMQPPPPSAAADPHAPSIVDSGVRTTLAPTGRLRVAMYRGSPSSIVEASAPAEPRGVGYDLGREMAGRLGVPFAPVVFERNADALAAIKAGDADVTFTNASPARARDMDFSPGFMDVEKSFLVPARSSLASIDDLKRPGLRIGVSVGSSTEGELAPDHPRAVLVRVPTLKEAGEMLANGQLDAFATNKAILFEVADRVAGSRVLPGRWGMEHFAIGIPKGRAAGRPFVDAFAQAIRAEGTVRRAVLRAGLRGTVDEPPAVPIRIAP